MQAPLLDTLLSLRRHELQTVERAFAEALKRENEASAAVRAAEQRVVDEQKLASAPDADDDAVEAFSQWLPVGRAAVEKARKVAVQAGLDREVARSALLLAQSAMELAQSLKDKRDEEERQGGLRREQKELDEMASRQSRAD